MCRGRYCLMLLAVKLFCDVYHDYDTTRDGFFFFYEIKY